MNHQRALIPTSLGQRLCLPRYPLYSAPTVRMEGAGRGVSQGQAGQHPAMRIAMLLIAVSQTMLAATFGVEWVRDQRRPPHQRSFGRHRKVSVVSAIMLAVASLTVAFLLDD